MSSWFADFDYEPGALRYKKTGVRVRLEWGVIQEFLAWLGYYLAIKAKRLAIGQARAFTIAFSPDRARPWYLLWPVLQRAGAHVVEDPAHADIVFHFDDSTISPAKAPLARAGALFMNFACHDVSKTRIGQAFEDVFGYPLRVDPRTHHGLAVEKSERNGAHDGRIVQCPREPRPGRCYQRLVRNEIGRGLVEDLRTPTVGGKPACVFLKRRPVAARFANANAEVFLTTPEAVFSAEEIERLGQFTARLGLDWGGLDVLRDSADGRLYIVDANKTDMGPPTALPLADKLRATDRLSEVLRDFIARRLG
jgi:hypothetical protein